MKLQSRLQIIDKHIKKMECVALADTDKKEGSALLNQLRVLREEIKTKAKKDYIEVQKQVLDSFRTLMEQLSTLSFYASEAEKDSRDIEKAISQMNKIKGTISENILGLEEEKDETKAPEVTASVTASVEDDVRKFVEDSNGKFYTNYAEWYSDVLKANLKPEINRSIVEAVDEEGNCLGKYVTDDMNGCLFNTVEDYDKAFEELDEDEDEDDDSEEEDDEILEGSEEYEDEDEDIVEEEEEEDED